MVNSISVRYRSRTRPTNEIQTPQIGGDRVCALHPTSLKVCNPCLKKPCLKKPCPRKERRYFVCFTSVVSVGFFCCMYCPPGWPLLHSLPPIEHLIFSFYAAFSARIMNREKTLCGPFCRLSALELTCNPVTCISDGECGYEDPCTPFTASCGLSS